VARLFLGWLVTLAFVGWFLLGPSLGKAAPVVEILQPRNGLKIRAKTAEAVLVRVSETNTPVARWSLKMECEGSSVARELASGTGEIDGASGATLTSESAAAGSTCKVTLSGRDAAGEEAESTVEIRSPESAYRL